MKAHEFHDHLEQQERILGLPPGTLINVFLQLLPILLGLFGNKPPVTPPVTPPAAQ